MDRHNNNKSAILATLLYEDIFHYPLSREELWRYLHSGTKMKKNEFRQALLRIKKSIVYRKGLYAIAGQEAYIKRRIGLEKNNKLKQKKAKAAAHLLSQIPTICFVGISGSVAMGNAEVKDDIDLFIITKKHTLWLTRLLVTLLLDSRHLRRKRYDNNFSDKICVNMLIDESALAFSKQKNIYIAHEIAQIKPVFDRGSFYKILLAKNVWIKDFLCNTVIPQKTPSAFSFPWTAFILPLEFASQTVQKWYMSKHKRNEILTKNILAFHPVSYEKQILSAFIKKKKQYGI